MSRNKFVAPEPVSYNKFVAPEPVSYNIFPELCPLVVAVVAVVPVDDEPLPQLVHVPPTEGHVGQDGQTGGTICVFNK